MFVFEDVEREAGIVCLGHHGLFGQEMRGSLLCELVEKQFFDLGASVAINLSLKFFEGCKQLAVLFIDGRDTDAERID